MLPNDGVGSMNEWVRLLNPPRSRCVWERGARVRREWCNHCPARHLGSSRPPAIEKETKAEKEKKADKKTGKAGKRSLEKKGDEGQGYVPPLSPPSLSLCIYSLHFPEPLHNLYFTSLAPL